MAIAIYLLASYLLLEMHVIYTAKLERSFRENSSGGLTRARGCCCGACDSGDHWYSFEDAGWLRRTCLTFLLVVSCILVSVFCGCCILILYIIAVCISNCDYCDGNDCTLSDCCCCCEDFCEEHCDIFDDDD